MRDAAITARILLSGSCEIGLVEAIWEEVYCRELSWVDSARPLFADAYDPHAAYMLLELDEGTGAVPIGAVRLVLDSDVGLPIERFFRFGPLKEDRRLVEIQRLAILQPYRSKRFRDAPFGLMARLLKEIMHYAIVKAKASHLVADVFMDPQVSPVGPLSQIGFVTIGAPFADTELASPIPSCAMVIGRGDFLERSLSRSSNPLLRYMAGDENFAVRRLALVDEPPPGRLTAT